MRRLEGASIAPFIFGIIVALAPVIWIFIYDSGIDDSQRLVYAIVISVGCGLGAYFGLKAGLKAQIVFQQKLEEYLRNTNQLPDNVEQTNDNLNKN